MNNEAQFEIVEEFRKSSEYLAIDIFRYCIYRWLIVYVLDRKGQLERAAFSFFWFHINPSLHQFYNGLADPEPDSRASKFGMDSFFCRLKWFEQIV